MARGDGDSLGRPEVFDAVVIGGGPAGSIAAYTLARLGRSVLLLEKSSHPRFHIGESLLPYGTHLLERLGLLADVQEGPFVVKPGAQVADIGGRQIRASFEDLPGHQKSYAFNVERAEFDGVLWQAAERAGATAVQAATVDELLFDGDRMTGVGYSCAGRRREARARFVVDASGRAGLVARHFRLRRMNSKLKNVAVFDQFRGTKKGVNLSDEGYIVIASHGEGWMWCIPLGPGRLSIGAVLPASALAQNDRRATFERHLARTPVVQECLEGSSPVFDELKVESDYCYHSERFAGRGWFLAGDSACFVDPLFSGGALLGMTSGMKAGEAIDRILSGGDESAVATVYENVCKTGYDTYFRLVYAFQFGCGGNLPELFRFLPGTYAPTLQLVAGGFWDGDENPAIRHLRSISGWDTFQEPFDLVSKCPIYEDADERLHA